MGFAVNIPRNAPGVVPNAGIIDLIADWFVGTGGHNLFVLYTMIVFGSVVVSAFVDNVPYVAAMLPVVAVMANDLGYSPVVLYFGLLIGATLGGNITPFGASANIAGLGILKKEGYAVSTRDFVKISIPYTLVAVIIGYAVIWFTNGTY